jgi:co-chaperonin GroES (HSP10)
MKIKALYNQILFQFIDKVNSIGQFEEQKSDGGIIIMGDHDKSAKTSRWATIVSLGPDCGTELRVPGCRILIENLRWTNGVKYEGEMIWKTDETQILAYKWPDDEIVGV